MTIKDKETLKENENFEKNENDDFNTSLFVGESKNNDLDIRKRLNDSKENMAIPMENECRSNDIPKLLEISTLTERAKSSVLENQIYDYFQKMPLTFSVVLPFQKRIVIDMLKADSLLILGRGMGYLKIISNLIYALDVSSSFISNSFERTNNKINKNNLIIVLGTREGETDFITQELRELSIIDEIFMKYKRTNGIKIINTDSTGTIEKRKKLYTQGGIFFVTARIFVVDLLCHVVSPTVVSGILVSHAEQVTETSAISFILRLYRQQNKAGFIKALSDDAEKFSGFSLLATYLKNLHISKTNLWPRFHVSVTDSIELQHLVYQNKTTGQWIKPHVMDVKSVIEIEVQLTPSMAIIQQSILSCIEMCISIIRKFNSKIIDMEEWNLNNALSTNFDFIIRRQLEPFWHRVSQQTKTNVFDLSTLRQLLSSLLSLDSISFYKMLETIWMTNSSTDSFIREVQNSWIYFDDANPLFAAAKERAFGKKDSMKSNTSSPENHRTEISLDIEELPKWDQLAKILEEVALTTKHQTNTGPILIMCSNRSTARQLSLYLKYSKKIEKSGSIFFSGNNYMKNVLNDYQEWKHGFLKIKKELSGSTKISARYDSVETKETEGTDKSSSSFNYNKRRRVRGGLQAVSISRSHKRFNYDQNKDKETLEKYEEDL